MSVFVGPEIVNSGLVLHLDAANVKSYPGTGTAWDDLSGNGNNGTLVNDPTYNNQAIVFDGADDYVEVSDSSSLNFTGSVTLSSWFKFNTLPTSETAFIIKEFQWHIGMLDSSTFNCVVWSPSWNTVNQATYSFSTDVWYNMVMTYNGLTVKVYINSTLVNTVATFGFDSIYTDTYPVIIGTYPVNSTLDGNISDIKIYSRDLSDKEIQQNFNAMRGRYDV